jgi:hypothetical protein
LFDISSKGNHIGEVQRKPEEYACPDPVIRRIAELEENGDSWSLGVAEIRDLLDLSSKEFYRRIYAAERRDHPLISLDSATGRYSQENIWEFVALVELFCGAETEQRLERAGIFFSHSEQMEILGVFLQQTAAAIRLHKLDTGQFSAMLRTFGSFEPARDVYIEEYFPLDALLDRAATAYCAERDFTIPELARANVRKLLAFFFQKHVLKIGSIFALLNDRLIGEAAARGYVAAGERFTGEQKREDAAVPGSSPHLQRARRTMNLEGRTLSSGLLKREYKRLMKIYHPDINPKGLRRCQEITAAYSLLLSSL